MESQKIRRAVPNYQAMFFDGLRKVMQVPSVKSAPKPGAPFGEEPRRVLEVTLDIAKELGFKTGVVKDAVGYVQYGNDDENYVAVLGHLDVVPEGTGWSYPPFDLTENAGVLYGRGILDNKGPIISTLYALFILKELGVPMEKTVRIILGTDEESGMSDIPMYLEQEPAPMYGFTPDCKFPAVYGERGMVSLRFTTSRQLVDGKNDVTAIAGDFVRSSVPDLLTYTLANGKTCEVTGKRSPSNAPEMGVNVITLMAEQLKDEQLSPCEKEYLTWVAQSFHDKHDGVGLDINFSDEDSGTLQLTPYTIELTDDHIHLEVSMRYPISVTEAQITDKIFPQLPSNTEMEVIRRFPSKLFPKDHPMVTSMTEVYELCTGMDGTPVTTTGATYARTMPNTIAFGPSFPGQKGIAHNKDEYMDVSDLMLNMEIYALTIYRLANLEV